LYSAAYITLCRMTFKLVECRPHPSAPHVQDTLVHYADIECGSDRHRHWTIMLGLGVSIAAFTVGLLAFFTWLCWIAPSSYKSVQFRARTGFLLLRWEPTAWYFGPICMVRNLGIAVTPVFYPVDGRQQLAWCATCSALYAFISGLFRPWRCGTINKLDGAMMASMAILCVFVLSIGGDATRMLKYQIFVIVPFFVLLCVPFCALIISLRNISAGLEASKASRERVGPLLADLGNRVREVEAETPGGVSERMLNGMTSSERDNLSVSLGVFEESLDGNHRTKGRLGIGMMSSRVQTGVKQP